MYFLINAFLETVRPIKEQSWFNGNSVLGNDKMTYLGRILFLSILLVLFAKQSEAVCGYEVI